MSERYLANLEMGAGNSSILVLERLAQALGSTLINLLGDPLTRSAQGAQIRELLCDQPPATLQIVLDTLKQVLAAVPADPGRNRRIALVGLRGAGKSTLGRMLADELSMPFIEITNEIERIAGCGPSEIHALYGATAYHRMNITHSKKYWSVIRGWSSHRHVGSCRRPGHSTCCSRTASQYGCVRRRKIT